MPDFALTILGCGGAVPAFGRHPSGQFLRIGGDYCLIDCGEGTQFRMQEKGLPWGKIGHVFISHLHGDHVFGLAPLITTWHLTGRTRPLHLWSPPGLEDMVSHLFRHTRCQPSFPMHWHEIGEGERREIWKEDGWSVRSIPLNHRIPTTGFLFKAEEGSGRGLRKTGQSGKPGGRAYRYAYCSDTAFHPTLLPDIQGVDLLYHEATFLDKDREKALATGHSTAREAGEIARRANAGRLLLGHFSARYRDLGILLREAQSEFPHSELAREQITWSDKDGSSPSLNGDS